MLWRTWLLLIQILSFGGTCVWADIYMHNPRGSNNKLNEQNNNRNNGNRLFDSQNNGNGGYNHGDKCDGPCHGNGNGENAEYNKDLPGAGEGIMEFYEGSELQVEWTNQHGCGLNPRLHCNVVMQYMCEDSAPGLRDGTTTDTIPVIDADNIVYPNDWLTYGQHEPFWYYNQCSVRPRNKGLFLADRNLGGGQATARYTRQNNGGTRYGYECPEEKDYYPYWHPTPWRDIYTCTDEPARCSYYREQSQNVVNKGNCSLPSYNVKLDCENAGGRWEFVGKWNMDKPECGICPTTRNNHLGEASNSPGQGPHYTWTIPEDLHPDGALCVLRIRYNISTFDYDGWSTDSLFNGQNSKVKGNPTNDFVGLGQNSSGPLTLNINTAQFGRTFQDRSHVFRIRKAPKDLKRNFIGTSKIINLNVRGRRGNIVQVYPSVEYDFVPNTVNAKKGDFLHIQWVGSDSNPNNDGNGRIRTDRSNLVLVSSQGVNYPLNINPDGASAPTHFTNHRDIISRLAYLDQTNCDLTTNDANDIRNCGRLNSAPAYFNAGLVRIDNTGTFNLISTRNNAFSNREQKMTLKVSQDMAAIGAAIGIAVAGVAFLAGTGYAAVGVAAYGLANPGTMAGAVVAFLGIKKRQKKKRSPDVLEVGEAEKKVGWLRAKLQKLWWWEGPRIMVVGLYTLANIIVWIYGWASNKDVSPAPYFPYAKGFGKMLNVNCSFIILPVLRNILCWLRSTPVADIIPLNDNIKMHKIVFGFTAFGGLAHATLHYLNFAWAHQRFGESIAKQALGNLVGITGHLISFIMLLMAITAFFNRKLINCFGRRFDGYRTFLLVHKLWIPCFVFLWLHGPQFWAFSIWPLLLMGMEKMVQTSRARVDVAIVEAKIVGRDVLALKMKLQSKRKFVYKAGEYLYLNCPQIAELEWHPFTISSAPEDAYFSCHIRCRPDMDWCFQLRTLLGLASSDKAAKPTVNVVASADIEKSAKAPDSFGGYQGPTAEAERSLVRLRVDGPYGSPSEEVFDHDTVVLVGAGIGVTPFISILKSISIRARQREIAGSMDNLQQQSLKVYFYWICRDEQEFHSFKDLIDAVIDSADLKDSLQVNTYTTGELNLKQVKLERYNQYSGKPNWGRILKEIAGDHQGEEIGVFLCGPPALARELQASCKRQNQTANKLNSKTIFKFHKESF